MPKLYTIEILDKNLNKVAEVQNPYPLNNGGDILVFSSELSNYGSCRFRVATKDPILDTYGDIFVPHQYHVRIRRYAEIVWQGAIVDNPRRNKSFIEVRAYEYLFYFDKKLVRRDAEVTVGDGRNNYRVFKTGTMASAVNSIITEMIADSGDNHILSNITIGTIDNPNYPNNMVSASGTQLTGAWNFSEYVAMQFDYHSILHVLKSFGAVSNADFEITNDLVFNFRNNIGSVRSDLSFTYGTHGNIQNYDVPRYGSRMINRYYGIATNEKGALLRYDDTDSTSLNTYGLLESATAYADVINDNVLRSRIKEEMNLLKDPDAAPINLVISKNVYGFGVVNVGDIINVRINDGLIDFNEPRTMVAISLVLHNTGSERLSLQTNKPRDADLTS